MSDKTTPKDAKQEKADRLAQALRENLRKRKAQARSRNIPKKQAGALAQDQDKDA